MAGALPKEHRNLLSQLIFRLSRNGSCPQSCPQPCFVSALIGRRDSTYRLALGRSANPSKPTNPTTQPWSAGRKTELQPFSFARASTVGKPSKAYKPHQPARSAGLRTPPCFFTCSRFVGKKPFKTHQTLPSHPAGCSYKPPNSKQHQRGNLGCQPPLTWQPSARSSRSTQMEADAQHSSSEGDESVRFSARLCRTATTLLELLKAIAVGKEVIENGIGELDSIFGIRL